MADIQALINKMTSDKAEEMAQRKQQIEQEKSFEELLKIHSVSLSNETLDKAILDLEKNMDQESFENFVKAKMESLNKDNK